MKIPAETKLKDTSIGSWRLKSIDSIKINLF